MHMLDSLNILEAKTNESHRLVVYPMSGKIGCSLIGCGYWGSKLQRYIEENKNFYLKYVCNSKFDLSKVWRDKQVQVVIVATPNATHYQIVKEALIAGKHVLSEKPLALKTSQCLEMKKIAEDSDLKLHVEYTYTFSKSIKKAVEWVHKGKIGKLLSMEMSTKHLGRFGGGSVYWLLGSHMLAVLDMFVPLQDLKFRRKNMVLHKNQVETGIILFEGVIAGQIFVSLNHPFKEAKIIIYGENGTIIYNPRDQPIPLRLMKYERLRWTVGSKLPKQTETYIADEGNNLRLAIKSFYNVLGGKEESNIARAVLVTKILEDLRCLSDFNNIR